MKRFFAKAAVLTAATFSAQFGMAADFPSKPIRIVVPFNAGSGSDETSRVYGEIVSKMLNSCSDSPDDLAHSEFRLAVAG